MKRRSFLQLAAVAAASSAFAGRHPVSTLLAPADEAREDVGDLVHHDTWIMGQIARIWVQGVPEEQAHEGINAAFAAMRALDRTLSRFDAGSELRAFLDAPAGRSVAISAELAEAVAQARALHAATDGAFDPTFAPGRPAPGMSHLRLDGNQLSRTSEEVLLDFGGSGCGMALDRAALELRRHGVRRALLELSGDFLALEAPAGFEGWPLEIADPWTGDPSGLRIDLRHAALAVSSAVEPGRIFDPSDGRPASAQAQAAVLAPTAIEADAFSTAAVVRERPVAGIRVLHHRWDGSAG